MSRRDTTLLKAALSALHHTGASRALTPWTRGDGIIFTLHHVRPYRQRAFEPNRLLEITPEFLATAIRETRDAGFDIVAMDEVAVRLAAPMRDGRPFAAFTLDDGYRDNLEFAAPVFRRSRVPYTVYVADAFAEGRGDLWWLVLEEVLARVDRVEVVVGGTERRFEAGSVAEKYQAFHELYWWLRSLPEPEARAIVARLAATAGYDAAPLCSNLVMNWDEIRDLARDPLVTVGAHTLEHYALAKLAADDMRAEVAGSVARVADRLDRPCRHFSYPYGDASSAGDREFALAASLGLATAVTTRRGMLWCERDKAASLPRVSLNGLYQEARFVRVFLSGAPFAFDLANRRPAGIEEPGLLPGTGVTAAASS